jgi:hypothetical protein
MEVWLQTVSFSLALEGGLPSYVVQSRA